ncbi:hypothetical protein CesoFtcFv8_006235 [Champsocephalus esox]|uniref:Uncharacterized protein n=1 Tax=Champsocephalus esox TaxID=159716 RepID=A0AAN8H6N5_9TELE|nr:hypothetical protein CesoFtcFv8_006235 [Champsocephalus esox]
MSAAGSSAYTPNFTCLRSTHLSQPSPYFTALLSPAVVGVRGQLQTLPRSAGSLRPETDLRFHLHSRRPLSQS